MLSRLEPEQDPGPLGADRTDPSEGGSRWTSDAASELASHAGQPALPDENDVKGMPAIDEGATDQRVATTGVTAATWVDQSLERLERNTLEVKLYLDSIDQRISRMEPRLDGIRAAASDADSRADPIAGPVTDAEWNPGSSTTERRRRVQGVPVERRRPPYSAASWEVEQARWKAAPGSWRTMGKSWRTIVRYWRSMRAGWQTWAAGHKAWVFGAALAAAAFLGLLLAGSGRHTGPTRQTRVEHSGPVLTGRIPAGGSAAGEMAADGSPGGVRKGSAGVPFSTFEVPPTGEPSQGSQSLPGTNAVERVSGGPTIVEQGIAAPADRAAFVARSPTLAGGAARPSAAADRQVGASNSGPGTSVRAVSGHVAAGDLGGPVTGTSGTAVRAAVPGAGASRPGTSRSGASRSSSTPRDRTSVPLSRRVNVSSGVMAGNLIYSPQPDYPKGLAGLFRMEGEVVMQAIISKNGSVEDLRVLSGHVMLRGSAKDAVRTWRYRPYTVNGSPVEVATIVSVEFHR